MPTRWSPSRANATYSECSNDRRRASGERPLSKSSAARSAFARAQLIPARESSIAIAMEESMPQLVQSRRPGCAATGNQALTPNRPILAAGSDDLPGLTNALDGVA